MNTISQHKPKSKYASLFTLRKDGRYQGSYTDSTGRHFLYDRDPERLWHRLNDPKPEATFAEIASQWNREHTEQISYKTAEAYVAPLRRITEQFGDATIEGITAAEINAFLVQLAKQGYSRRTVQMHRDILNMICNYAIVDGHIKFNPCTAVTMPRNLPTTKRNLPDDDAIAAVRASADAPFSLFALICLYAGLRRGEALALCYEDVDRKARAIHITKAVEYLGNDARIKPPKTAAGYRDTVLLDPLAELIPDGNGLIFCRDDGGPLTKTQYRKRWEKYCQAIGYEITAHQLRHGFATILYEAGIPDKDAQELLGHSSITVTRDVYTHIRQARKSETLDRLNDYCCQK